MTNGISRCCNRPDDCMHSLSGRCVIDHASSGCEACSEVVSPGSLAFGHARHVVMLTLWVTIYLPLWLVTEGVERSLRWIATSHSPSGY